MNFKKTPLMLAIAAMVASPIVLADGHHGRSEHWQQPPVSKAQINDVQFNTNNMVKNTLNTNKATLNGNALRGASGNVEANVAAGDNNFQDNAVSLAQSDANFVFGTSEASVGTQQSATYLTTANSGNHNNASLTNSAMFGASGNVAANVAAGDSNLQKNNLAVSVANGSRAVSNVSNMQSSAGNRTTNAGYIGSVTYTNSVNLQASLSGGYFGFEAGRIYSSDSHRRGGQEDGYRGHHHSVSKYVGMAAGTIALSGTVSGYAEQTIPIVQPSRNDASLGGSALAYASGNIGVNVASGSGNMQNNSMAIAVSNQGGSLPQ